MYTAELFKRNFFTRNFYNISQSLNQEDKSSINHRQVSRFLEVTNPNVSIAELTKDLSQILIVVILATLIVSTYHPFFVVFCSCIIFLTFITITFFFPTLLHKKSIISDVKYKINESLIRIIDEGYEVSEEDFQNLSYKFLSYKSSVFKIIIAKSCLIGLLVSASLGLFLIVSGNLIFETEPSVGQFVAAELVITYLLTNIYYFTRALEKLITNVVSLDKIDSVLTAKIKKAV